MWDTLAQQSPNIESKPAVLCPLEYGVIRVIQWLRLPIFYKKRHGDEKCTFKTVIN